MNRLLILYFILLLLTSCSPNMDLEKIKETNDKILYYEYRGFIDANLHLEDLKSNYTGQIDKYTKIHKTNQSGSIQYVTEKGYYGIMGNGTLVEFETAGLSASMEENDIEADGFFVDSISMLIADLDENEMTTKIKDDYFIIEININIENLYRGTTYSESFNLYEKKPEVIKTYYFDVESALLKKQTLYFEGLIPLINDNMFFNQTTYFTAHSIEPTKIDAQEMENAITMEEYLDR